MNETEHPRRSRVGLIVALVAALVLVCCGGGAASYFLDGLNGSNGQAFGSACGRQGLLVDPNGKIDRIGRLSEDQMRNAAVIIAVGQKMNVPPRGWVIAIATALQESVLSNLPNLGAKNDHDSVGLFQQRPSQGWGTVEEIMDPQYASTKFYEKLVKVSNWESRSVTDAAQEVQHSAYPDAYAKHEPLAALIVNSLAEGAALAVGSLTTLRCTFAGETSAAGWTVPVLADVVSGFRTPERPTHYGVDLGAPKGTVIHAAAAGTVITAKCNVSAGWSCDRDGSSSIQGCGWYVDILHAANIITRYCHMVSRPDVVVGQSVTAGQPIGHSGSSGNSSGPHVHFEVHENGDPGHDGAIDPVAFMVKVGAPLGSKNLPPTPAGTKQQ
jgi:murein DD-endopeptidase MepM/ murein hydrolase activator NlpD